MATHKISRLRYLSAYARDLNPIEQGFARLTAALRKGAARSVNLCRSSSAGSASRLRRRFVQLLWASSRYQAIHVMWKMLLARIDLQ